ncbi:MAG: endonuclease MutS2 [Anaerolineales bacterium]|nr:endonuclease MutS2 [Anaerolineales bacterium]
MDEKSLRTLELHRVLERLAEHASFSASRERILAMRPAADLSAARQWLDETGQARMLIDRHADISIGGARDIRPAAEDAARGITLPVESLVAVRATLGSARAIRRSLARIADEAPALNRIALRMEDGSGLIDAIGRTINDEGEVLDSASPKLGALRAEVRTIHDRLLTRLQRILSEHASQLQEPILTQREGRYVIPLRSEFKGRLRGIVHDQSSSGATLFIEPLATVELGNRWREAILEEQEEIHRILAALSDQIGRQREPIIRTVDSLADFDAAVARARYAAVLNAVRAELVEIPASPPEDFTPLLFHAARHPLLDPAQVVPIDIALRPGVRALVITGPNTGGKTVALKTAGLLALMIQCGMHIPAGNGSKSALFDSIYADIGDEQSIEQSLSTFSAHVGQIIRILAAATPQSLVILDELGAGTDPQEGSGLARAILSELLRRGIPTLVATHYPELKAFAYNTPGAENACMEFDLRTLRPTYRLILGLPGRSNALAIARRLGLPEEILAVARSMVDAGDLEADRLLEKIQRERETARRERADAEKLNRRALQRERTLAHRLGGIEEERNRILEESRAQAEHELEGLLDELRALRRRAGHAAAPELQKIAAEARELEDRIERNTQKPGVENPAAAPLREARVGDTVRMKGLGVSGKITGREGGAYELQLGALRIRAERGDFILPEDVPAPEKSASVIKASPSPTTRTAKHSPGLELDMRGMMVEDGLIELDRYIDSAVAAGLPWVRIIHGKGSGKLRGAVREALRKHPQVANVETGGEIEGGEGVTIARLET